MKSSLLGLFSFSLILALAFTSCNSSKSYYKKGTQLKQAGLQDEAAEFYLLALQKNANNVDARIALKQEGQKLLEFMGQDFYKLYTAEDHIEQRVNIAKLWLILIW